MRDITTALESVQCSGLFDDDPINKTYLENRVAELMIDFAKLHVEAALKAASNAAFPDSKWDVEQSYPLENIK